MNGFSLGVCADYTVRNIFISILMQTNHRPLSGSEWSFIGEQATEYLTTG